MLVGGCPVASSRELDEERLASLRADIEALIANRSCATDGECSARAVGVAPCGGPSFYLAYSPANVDEAALAEEIRQYNELAQDMNRRYGISGNCIVVPEPTVTCQNGACTANNPTLPRAMSE